MTLNIQMMCTQDLTACCMQSNPSPHQQFRYEKLNSFIDDKPRTFPTKFQIGYEKLNSLIDDKLRTFPTKFPPCKF